MILKEAEEHKELHSEPLHYPHEQEQRQAMRARKRNNKNQRRFKPEHEAHGHDLPSAKPMDYRPAVLTIPQQMGQSEPNECKGQNEKQNTDNTISEESSTGGESFQGSQGTMIDVLEVPKCGGNTGPERWSPTQPSPQPEVQ